MTWELINGPAPDRKLNYVWKCSRTQTTTIIHKVRGRFHWAVWRNDKKIGKHRKPPVMANTAKIQAMRFLATLPDAL